MVRSELLAILECPHCHQPHLTYHAEQHVLACATCHHTYGFENNIPLLYNNDDVWLPKQREAAGWVAMWQELGMHQEQEIDPRLPLVEEEPWATVGRMFRAALFSMNLTGGERILDIGAGEGWSGPHFSQRGAHVVAIDIVADAYNGLGKAWKRMSITNTIYDLVIGDNEQLPFQPNTFDFVFSCSTLHHSDHLDRMFANIYRVLKPSGWLIAVGDPVASIFQTEDDFTDGDREKAHGIIERRRHFYEYMLALWQAGFRRFHVEDEATFWQDNHTLYPWLDQQRAAIEQHAIAGSTLPTKLLTTLMLRLPRPFALALLLSLRNGGLLLVSAEKPARLQ